MPRAPRIAGGAATPASLASGAADDNPAVRFLALTARGHTGNRRDGVVHDLALEGVHRVQALGLAGLLDPAGNLACSRDELGATALAIVLHVHDDMTPLTGPVVHDTPHQLLERVQRLAVTADQQRDALLIVGGPHVDVHGPLLVHGLDLRP